MTRAIAGLLGIGVVASLWAGPSFADPPGEPSGVPFAIERRLDELTTSVAALTSDLAALASDVDALATSLGSLSAQIAELSTDVGALSAQLGGLSTDVTMIKGDTAEIKANVEDLHGVWVVKAHVDTEACTTGLVQCTFAVPEPELGQPATDENDNPVRLLVQVSRRGALPVGALLAGNFELGGSFFPAGAAPPVFCPDTSSVPPTAQSCSDSAFMDDGGLYQLFMRPPADVATWKAGQYAVELYVRDESDQIRGTTLVTFVIPDAEPIGP